MTGKVKVKGDLLLAQRLEEAVEKMGAREVGFKEKTCDRGCITDLFYTLARHCLYQGKQRNGKHCY
jgi:hypothetical protein